MRSRNSLMRERREAFRDARLIVIATEGKDTVVKTEQTVTAKTAMLLQI